MELNYSIELVTFPFVKEGRFTFDFFMVLNILLDK